MRLKGFTLAEILVALTVVGIVAALAMPQFLANIHNQANASKLATIVSDYENVFGMMMLKENKDNFFETDFGTAYSASSVNTALLTTALEKYIKVNKIGTSTSNLGYIACNFDNILIPTAVATEAVTVMRTITNESVSQQSVFKFKFGVVTPSGACIFFDTPSNYISTIFVDTNGSSSPNKFGRDVFAYVLDSDGRLYPYGSLGAARTLSAGDTNVWDNSSATDLYKCNGTSGYNGLGCTARLAENNYKMDY